MPSHSIHLEVDFGVTSGVIKPLHGVNLGPVQMNGFMDTSARFKELGFPYTRLHDCAYAVPDTVDVHSIFPIFDADPQDPGNYRFAVTDDYIQAILDIGSKIVYRLGETIEHHTRSKYWVHPPKDFQKWAAICVNIIRHYNEGWANGFHHDIRYWEIWNEPWNTPSCWTGTDHDYFRLYEITAKAIKAHDPRLLVGGASITGVIGPREFGPNFLEHCRRTGTPVDFFSWHRYTADPAEIVKEAGMVRTLLAQYGFDQTESHLNEWSYLPSEGWQFCWSEKDPACIHRAADEISGTHGAAFIAATLIHLQDCAVDLANYYWALNSLWGFLDPYGAPRKSFHALRAFRALLDTPLRARSTPNDAARGYALLAGTAESRQSGILLANNRSQATEFTLSINNWRWPGRAVCRHYRLDADHDLTLVDQTTLDHQHGDIHLHLPSPTCSLFTLTPAEVDAAVMGTSAVQ
jgi:xylan 1,4-beta-xylosidase